MSTFFGRLSDAGIWANLGSFQSNSLAFFNFIWSQTIPQHSTENHRFQHFALWAVWEAAAGQNAKNNYPFHFFLNQISDFQFKNVKWRIWFTVQDVSSRARRSLLPKNWEKALRPAARGLASAAKHWSQNFPTVILLDSKACHPKRLFDSPTSPTNIMLIAVSVLQLKSFAWPTIPVSHDVHHSTYLVCRKPLAGMIENVICGSTPMVSWPS